MQMSLRKLRKKINAFLLKHAGSAHPGAQSLTILKPYKSLLYVWIVTLLVRAECVRCPWLLAEMKVATILGNIGPSIVHALPLAAGRNEGGHYFRYIFLFGPSGVRALPLGAGRNESGHYFGPSRVRALPLTAGINVGGHYFW